MADILSTLAYNMHCLVLQHVMTIGSYGSKLSSAEPGFISCRDWYLYRSSV